MPKSIYATILFGLSVLTAIAFAIQFLGISAADCAAPGAILMGSLIITGLMFFSDGRIDRRKRGIERVS